MQTLLTSILSLIVLKNMLQNLRKVMYYFGTLSLYMDHINKKVKDIQEMYSVMQKFHQLTGRMLPICNLLPDGLTVTKEAREMGLQEQFNTYTAATAIVLNSLAHRIIGDFIIKIQRPKMPFKMFNSEYDAYQWLSKYSEN